MKPLRTDQVRVETKFFVFQIHVHSQQRIHDAEQLSYFSLHANIEVND